MGLNVKFINPFIQAAVSVLKTEIGVDVTRGKVALQKSGTTSKDITVALGVTGDVRGAVFYGLSQDTAREFVSQMLGEPVPIFDHLCESAVGELGNVITGMASANLEREGYVCKISPPTLVSGKGVYISTLDFHRLIMPIHTEFGDLEINVALKADDHG